MKFSILIFLFPILAIAQVQLPFTSLVAQPPPTYALMDSLLAYYTFESDGRDTSGRGHHLDGSIGDEQPTFAVGKFGKGTVTKDEGVPRSRWVGAGVQSTLDSAHSWTVGGWWRWDISVWAGFISAYDDYGWQIWAGGDGTIKFQTRNGSISQEDIGGDTTLVSGNWYFLVGTYNSITDSLALYINGSTPKKGRPTVGWSTPSNYLGTFNVNGAHRNGDRSLGGMGDEVFVFQRILSDTEISWLYNSGTGRSWNEWQGDTAKIDWNPAVRNGGFETTGSPFGTWTLDAGGASSARDTSEVYSGSHAVVLYRETGQWCYYTNAALTAGKHYNISVWAKALSGTPFLTIKTGDDDYGTGWQQASTTTWTQYTRTNVEAIHMNFGIGVTTNGGEIIFDNIRVVQLD